MELDLGTFSTESAKVCREFVIRTYVPEEDVPKTLQAVTEIVPLRYGSYENVAFQSPPGVQKFRPLCQALILVIRRRFLTFPLSS